MFSSSVIDLVILLSFTYFIGSLVLAAINEAIAGTFKLRQKDLRNGLCNFFFDPAWRTYVNTVLLKSPHIQSLMKNERHLPAYIPARNFVLAIKSSLEPSLYEIGVVQSKTTQVELPPELVRAGGPVQLLRQELPATAVTALAGIMQSAAQAPAPERIKVFEEGLEEYYNNAMDRVTGWYKHRVRKILFMLAFVLSVLLNLDTISIVNNALKDPEKLTKAVDNIVANLQSIDSLKGPIRVYDDSITASPTPAAAVDKTQKLLIKYEQTTTYRIGYATTEEFWKQWRTEFWKKLLGVLITAFALQMGSNYWFDLMNKAVNVRASGVRPTPAKK